MYFLKLLKRSGLSADDLLCFYKTVIRSVLEYGSVVWLRHHHLTLAQSDKLEALQKRVVRIILYPLTLPYITALGYLKLESLKHRRTEADKKFFNSISQPDSCLHHLLPPPRDTQLIIKLRCANTYPVPLIKTKRFFFYQFWPGELCRLIILLYIVCILYVYILHIVLYLCRPILIDLCRMMYFCIFTCSSGA